MALGPNGQTHGGSWKLIPGQLELTEDEQSSLKGYPTEEEANDAASFMGYEVLGLFKTIEALAPSVEAASEDNKWENERWIAIDRY